MIILLVVVFLAGAGLSAVWFHYKSAASARPASSTAAVAALSSGTKAVLASMRDPVQIRFYSLLDTANLPHAVPAFAERVSSLLSAYVQESGGKITAQQITTPADENAQAAATEGLRAFNTDKGDACFLGLVLSSGSRKEVMPLLSPEWEAALESDITRAVARMTEPADAIAGGPVKADPAVIDSVRKAVPNLDSTSLEDGVKVLRQNTLNELQTAAQEMEARAKEVQQRIASQQGLSEAAQQALKQEIEKLQMEQARKLKQIVDRSQAQIQALKELKAQ